MQRLIVASSIKGLAETIAKEGYDVVQSVDTTNDLQRLFGSSEALANTLLVTEKIEQQGSLVNILLDIHEHFPEVRIIFLATGTLENRYTVNQLHMLCSHGIYDLFYEGRITREKIHHLLDNPKESSDCIAIEEKFKEFKDIAPTPIATVIKESIKDETIKNNIVAVTSVKPGTGKSFVSSNLAVTLAKYGKKDDGSKPKVLLLEGDLQTLSVYTLFGIKDEKYNLRAALRMIDTYMEYHSVDEWFNGAEDIKEFIRHCCLRTSIDNLYILEGHDFDVNETSSCDGASYYYLTMYLATLYDQIVIDSNSSLQHATTDPILQLSKTLYFVFTTDFNNLKLNVRYQDELANLGVKDKVKYVLNKALFGEQKLNYTFEYDDKEIVGNKLRIDYEIPLVDMAVILNSTYKHEMLAMDNTPKTLFVREKFIRLANDVMPLGDIDEFVNEIEILKKKLKFKK